ncbi:class I SAM-dependent methyltransferase [Paenibacillus athensensis]|uniref:Methyltransferase type 12 n=1 Tax=Paenibacillus athensensis TaxID=1967502 RepID=A0A4Y8PVF0_9BACL|nr:class I SAM-dependent methyltransferase [Paenibacillus athensensis]MCD1261713.1 class I SAM-dependent methyltransferase [Paenibacillus athensensis]
MANTDKFEAIAGTYDAPERIKIARLSADAIRAYIGDAAERSAIDFGCGTGLVGLELLPEFGSVLFLDSSANMIEQVNRKIAARSLTRAEARCLDLEREGLPDLRADYIFMVQVLLHIPDVEALLTRLRSMLNEGGHLLIVDFDKNEHVASPLVHNGFDQAKLADLMTKIGYTGIQSRTFYTGQRLFMGQDASMFVLDSRK